MEPNISQKGCCCDNKIECVLLSDNKTESSSIDNEAMVNSSTASSLESLDEIFNQTACVDKEFLDSSDKEKEDVAATTASVERALMKSLERVDERNRIMENALDRITRTNERLDTMLHDPLIQAIQAARASRRQSQL